MTFPVQHHIPEALMYDYFQSVAQVYSILFRKLHDVSINGGAQQKINMYADQGLEVRKSEGIN